MVRTLLGRLVLPLVALAVMVAGFDAEAAHRRNRRSACCEPCCEVVYEPACPAPCRTVVVDPCPPVDCCAPRHVHHAHVHHAHVVVEQEVIVAPARCCASATPVRVIGETLVVTSEAPRATTAAPSSGRVVATPVSRSVR